MISVRRITIKTDALCTCFYSIPIAELVFLNLETLTASLIGKTINRKKLLMISSDFKVTSAIDEPRALAASLIESLNNSNEVNSIYKLKELFSKGHEQRNQVLNALNESCKGMYRALTAKISLQSYLKWQSS